jgi:hypothetical protein
MDTQPVPSLVTVLAQVPDPRMARGQRHPWTALLLLIVVGLLSGANTQQAPPPGRKARSGMGFSVRKESAHDFLSRGGRRGKWAATFVIAL